MSDSGSYNYSYSYSYSSSSSEPKAANEAMWSQITRIPVDLLEKTDDFMYVEKVMSLISKYDFTLDDPHMRKPESTTRIGRLLKLVSSQCGKRIAVLEKETKDAAKTAEETEAFLRKKVELQNSELAKLRRIKSDSGDAGTTTSPAPDAAKDGDDTSAAASPLSPREDEIRQLRVENDLLSAELRKMSRANSEMKESLEARRREQAQSYGDSDKLHLEYKHLVARHRRLLEKSQKTEALLNELRTKEKSKRHNTDTELDHLREKVRQLQQDNLNLIDSRDHAEELCEKREAEALRDMTELRRLTKDLLDEERAKVRQIREEYMSVKQQADAHVEELLQQHDDDLRSKDEEITLLRRQVEKLAGKRTHRHFNDDSSSFATSDPHERDETSVSVDASSSSTGTSESSSSADAKRRHKSSKQGITNASAALQRKLERENDDLQAEVEELELRVDAVEEENRRLTRLVKDYESGDEGLVHLRHELGDATRTVEVLQDENAQLRERLNGMEDSLTFTAALQELCKRMGVTEEEINSLKPQNTAAYSEMDTLKEELNVLKEEVEWLEKERRLWMNKVRLQPLMDTKLRFELGLTSEQLRQLDKLVDQMKAGNLVVEDDDKSYKERYFMELEARRKDASQFSEYVKSRIEEALRSAFDSETDGAGGTASVLATLRDHIDLLATAAGTGTGDADPTAGPGEGKGTLGTVAELTRRQLKEQLDSAKRQMEQMALTAKDNAEAVAELREKLAAARAEADLTAKERDQYREAVFAAAGAYSRSARGGDGTAESGAAAGEDVAASGRTPGAADAAPLSQEHLPGFQSKWATVANTLRDQLKAKDELIESLNKRLTEEQDKCTDHKREAGAQQSALEAERRVQGELKDQLSALQEINEDLNAKNRELLGINGELEKGLRGLDDGSKTKELLQKVVLLRRREAKLLARLRRAITAQEEAAASEKKLRAEMDHTFRSLREALEGSSSGFVLPPSSAAHNFEEEQLSHLHDSVHNLLNGRLFREDSRYLVHLQQVYHTMENNEEVTALRLRERDCLKRIDSLLAEVDQLKVTVTELQQQQHHAQPSAEEASSAQASPAMTGAHTAHGNASVSKWESESVLWRQKYELCHKRLEARESEVALLEKELDTARQEIVDVKDHVRNILSGDEKTRDTSARATAGDSGAGRGEGEKAASSPNEDSVLGAEMLARYEREVARLKSINLGLLQHTLDLQGSVKSLEVDLEARNQELTLLKGAGNSNLINDFVSAAVREHAALRRQSELALIQARRMRIQLAATEANYQVVANEATAYKLSAYRLYRRYVDEMVGIVDYVRCVQRASKGGLSPHRAEMMDQRFQRLAQELDSALHDNKALAVDLSDKESVIATFQQQRSLSQLARGSAERQDALEARLREARAAAREAAREITECKEHGKYAERKVQRLEAYVRQLTDEVTRLELGSLAGVSPLDEELWQNLMHLKETVFAKAEAPPLAISSDASGGGATSEGPLRGRRSGVLATAAGEDPDLAIREYKAAVVRQRELAAECEALRRDLGSKNKEVERLAASIADQKDMIQRLEEKAAFYQKQLDDERGKAEARENRMKRAHETQAEVSRRATEHNAQCLREMVQKKENEIVQLREQLNAERRRGMEQQLEEAARMERVHEGMFRENNAMVERFKVAINSVGDSLLADKPPFSSSAAAGGGGADASTSSVWEQLRYLTSETIRLQRELEASRATNIVLETQLSQQVSEAQHGLASGLSPEHHPLPTAGTQTFSQPSLSSGDNRHVTGSGSHETGNPAPLAPSDANTAPAPGPFPVPGDAPAPGGASRSSSSVEALASIVKSQSVMIESLRQREAAISNELQLEKQHHLTAQRALEELRLRHIEKDGALQLVSQVTSTASDPPQVRELRAQLSFAEQELRDAREQLERERSTARQVQSDANAWKEHLEQLNLQVAHQQVEVDRSRTLAALNEGLQSDVNSLKEQNDKLVLASSLLKQRLLDEARKGGGDTARQNQHDLALAQRMGSLQQESAEHVKALDRRIREVQKELNGRAAKEAEMQAKNEELQRMVYGLHQQLRAKDREREDALSRPSVRGTARTPSPPRQRGPREEKGTQILTTVPPQEQAGAHAFASASRIDPSSASPALSSSPGQPAGTSPSAPQRDGLVAGPTTASTASPAAASAAVNREVLKTQRDNLQQISLLRSTVGRLEKDLAEVREQLKGEREAARSLRLQLQSAKKAAEEANARHARELAEAHHHKAAAATGAPPDGKSRRPQHEQQGDSSSSGVAKAATSSHASLLTAPPPSSSADAGVQDAVRRLMQQVAELEPKAARADRLEQELTELRAAGGSALSPTAAPSLASSVDIRNHVKTVTSLENVIDELRRQINVIMPIRVNELQHQKNEIQRMLQRALEDLAVAKGVPVDELRRQYAAPLLSESAQSVAELEAELLAKRNALLDLRFTQETLELRVGRLQRHLDDIMAVDTYQAKAKGQRAHQGQVESLEAVVANLQLVIRALQKENAELKTKVGVSFRYQELAREVTALRQREGELQRQLGHLVARAGASGSARNASSWASTTTKSMSEDKSARLQERLMAAQASADTYHAELEELRASLEAQLPHPSRNTQSDGSDRPQPPPSSTTTTTADGQLPRLGSSRPSVPHGSTGGVPPPLPPSPFTPAKGGGAALGPHGSMRHHHVPRK